MNLEASIVISMTALALVFAYRRIEYVDSIRTSTKIVACVVLVLLRLFLGLDILSFIPAWLLPIIRFIVPSTVYLMIGKKMDAGKAVYISIILWIGFIAKSSILDPVLIPKLTAGMTIIMSEQIAEIITSIITVILNFVVVLLMASLAKIEKIDRIDRVRFAFISIVTICELYVAIANRYIFNVYSESIIQNISIYLLIIHVFILLLIIFFERYLQNSSAERVAQINAVAAKYRFEAANAKQDAKKDIRKIHHDIKNHLIAIKQLKDSPDAQERYINGILEDVTSYESLVDTGNDLLDGLISEKIAVAPSDDISIDVKVDYRKCDFIADPDTCVIFGNALDNAIEACRKLDGKKNIKVDGIIAGGNFILSVVNPFDGTLHMMNGLPITSKANDGTHGIGSQSIKSAVEKYNGDLIFDSGTKGVFKLIIYIPVPDRVEQGLEEHNKKHINYRIKKSEM